MKNADFSKKVYKLYGYGKRQVQKLGWNRIRIEWKKPHHTYNADGLCYSPEADEPKILVDPKLKKRRKMSTLIEEVTHAFFWDKTEREVRKFSSVLAGLINKQIK